MPGVPRHERRSPVRDSSIILAHQTLTDKVGGDIGHLTTSVGLVRTRIDALEDILFGSRLGVLKVILLQLLSPAALQRVIKTKPAEQIHEFNDAAAAARRRNG